MKITSEQLAILAYLFGALIGWVLRGCVAREEKEQLRSGFQPKGGASEEALKNPPKLKTAQEDN